MSERTRWGMLLALPAGAIVASLLVGRYPVGIRDVVGALLGGEGVPATVRTLILHVRLPRAVCAALVGIDLALAGAAFQGLFRNPLVDSRILGVSAGAAFGAALALLAGVTWFAVDAVSFLFGVVAAVLVVAVARRFGGSVLILVISGILVGSLFSALLGVIKYTADPLDTLPAITFWLLGSLAGASWETVAKLLPVTTVGAGVLLLLRWRLNLLSLDEQEAGSLGLNVQRLRMGVVLTSTLLVASAVSQAGMIGWIGLITPHAARAMVGPDHTRVLPAAAAMGAVFLLSLDLVSRSASQSEVPLGVLTGLVGGPAFLLLFMRLLTKGGGWS
ncbi:MAG: FecCD family ABC transporter permease [Candidatus Bipolaricaulaceae bacterium]